MRKVSALLIAVAMTASVNAQQLKSGIDKSTFDESVRPQDDLFRYVNGTWLKTKEIPADKSNYGSFNALADLSEERLKEIIELAAKSSPKYPNPDMQKVGDLYLSYMDSVTIEKLGIKPVQPTLKTINALKSIKDLPALFAELGKLGVQRPFSVFIDQDAKKSTEYIFTVNQSGLGLPDRDYYFKQDEKFKNIRTEYEKYIATLMGLAGYKNGEAIAKKVIEMETEIAGFHWTRTQNRDDNKTYNKLLISDLQNSTPDFNWSQYFKKGGFPDLKNIIVRQPDYLVNLNTVLKKYSVEDWKNYLSYKTVNASAPVLSSAFVDASFNFFSKTLRGIPVNTPRWKRAVGAVEGSLGEVVGKIYVEKYFKPEAKKRMQELVGNLKVAFAERINTLEWMSDATKKEALAKLQKFGTKIGYPDVWKDYSKLKIKKGVLVENLKASNEFDYNEMLGKFGKPIDRNEWGMFPQTVNAYYNPTMNEIVFPAAILQPPFFDMTADDAVNYGGIGAVIGHEISHGFDDQGSQSDGDGNLRNWWASIDSVQFSERTKKLVEQYNGFNPIDSMHVNGAMTLGENIGDIGGLNVALHAYKISLKGKTSPVIDGFTGEQRFFIGWAQVWARKYRDAEMRNRLLTDVHSPSEYRCNGIISNMPEFYQAFGVKEGDKLYRPETVRVKIW